MLAKENLHTKKVAHLITCSKCGKTLNQDEVICKGCGSKKRTHYVDIEETLEMYPSIKGVVKSSNGTIKKRFKKARQKPEDPFRQNETHINEWHADKENDTWDHRVINADTGGVIHKEHESLKKHKSKKAEPSTKVED